MKMNALRLSVVVFLVAVITPAYLAAEKAIPKPQPTRLPYPRPTRLPLPCPYYLTHLNENGVKDRVFVPCKTPNPCIWPRPPVMTTHGGATTRSSIAYPPQCCPILYRQLSERSVVPYPLPYPCRFTPLPKPTKKPECARCRSNSECLQGKCWGSPLKCTDGDYDGLVRCGFKKECERCTSGLQCATMKCWKKKCVFKTKKSKAKCFPH